MAFAIRRFNPQLNPTYVKRILRLVSFPKIREGDSGIPKLYVKFWWPLFLALKTWLFLVKSDQKKS